MIDSKKLKMAVLVAGLGTMLATGTLFAAGEPTSLDGDNIEYDMNTGIMKASGNVLMKKGNANVAGKSAEYNTKTQEGRVEGNVIAVKDDMRMTCDMITTDTKDHMIASGNVNGTKGDRTFSGSRVDYFVPDEYVLIENGGTITSADGTFTADRLEGNLKTEYYKGIGNVHVVSPPNKLEAGGNQVEYYGNQQGMAILTGNAWAIQENNTLKGQKLTVYLADQGVKVKK